MKIVFDLDYTLLDTVKFKAALAKAALMKDASAEAVDLTPEEEHRYEGAYAKAVKIDNGRFDPDTLFKQLVETHAITEERKQEARDNFELVVNDTHKYLYEGAKELLEALRTRNVAVDLLTFGNEKWQDKKVRHSGLAELFGAVRCTERDKREVVRELGVGQDKVIIVNDNSQEMKEMMAVAPENKYVLKTGGPKPGLPELHLTTAENMDELAGVLGEEIDWKELQSEVRKLRAINEAKREASEANKANEEGKEGEGDEVKSERQNIEPPESHQPGSRR